MAKIIAVANQKGGVGKTTTAVNLSSALAQKNKKVLVVDVDPQGNTTSGLGIEKHSVENTVYDILVNDVDVEKVMLHFNGGGHKTDAACQIKGKTVEEVKNELLEFLGGL